MIKILLVEDDLEGAEAVRQYLEFSGFHVDMVASGEAAVEAVARGPQYDVVITDLRLPGIQGDELARSLLRRQAVPPRLIALSGEHATDDDKPFDVRLPKPCRPKILIEAIRGIISRPQEGH